MSGDGIVVSTGPTTVDPAALERAAGVLAGCAAALAEVGLVAARTASDPRLLVTLPVAPATGFRAETAVGSVAAGAGGAVAAAARVSALAVALRTVALRYRLGEEAAAAVVAIARRAAAEVVVAAAPAVLAGTAGVVAADVVYRAHQAQEELLVGAVGLALSGRLDASSLGTEFSAATRRAGDRLAGDAGAVLQPLARELAAHPEVVRELAATTPAVLDAALAQTPALAVAVAAVAPDAVPLDDVAAAGTVLAGLGTVTPLFRETPVRVRPAAVARAVPNGPPRGVADVLDGVARQSTGWTGTSMPLPGSRMPPSGPPPPGTVRLERVTSAAGRVAWVVEVPGTQTWNPLPGAGAVGRTPMDLTTNVRAVAGQPTATADAVVQAMRQAGVRAGEPVMVAGHSQGGLTAAALAADPAVRAEFTITHVVTAGSPVDGIPVPAGVRVLSLEHTGDLVPALDGTDAEGSPRRTVVTRDLSAAPAWAEQVARDPVQAHGWVQYVDTARLVDASDDPALRAFTASAAPFLDAPGAGVQVFDYRAERLP
ncbi:hypothetical protein GTR02_17775 [Kineococcus sp. R8]|uniref:hypothetical protein n=1 Tax=Kineococcus siccus TaxID=2696567 RepID=UPI0014121450|nr:hypothetical protein [Kineococcus siccus]NAZ83665.1 hypothetical protein [Kineococcus siccus]